MILIEMKDRDVAKNLRIRHHRDGKINSNSFDYKMQQG